MSRASSASDMVLTRSTPLGSALVQLWQEFFALLARNYLSRQACCGSVTGTDLYTHNCSRRSSLSDLPARSSRCPRLPTDFRQIGLDRVSFGVFGG